MFMSKESKKVTANTVITLLEKDCKTSLIVNILTACTFWGIWMLVCFILMRLFNSHILIFCILSILTVPLVYSTVGILFRTFNYNRDKVNALKDMKEPYIQFIYSIQDALVNKENFKDDYRLVAKIDMCAKDANNYVNVLGIYDKACEGNPKFVYTLLFITDIMRYGENVED